MPSPIAYTHDLDFDVIRIILSGSRAGSGIGPYPEIVCVCVCVGGGGGGVAKQFPTFSFHHGA